MMILTSEFLLRWARRIDKSSSIVASKKKRSAANLRDWIFGGRSLTSLLRFLFRANIPGRELFRNWMIGRSCLVDRTWHLTRCCRCLPKRKSDVISISVGFIQFIHVRRPLLSDYFMTNRKSVRMIKAAKLISRIEWEREKHSEYPGCWIEFNENFFARNHFLVSAWLDRLLQTLLHRLRFLISLRLSWLRAILFS